MIRERGMDMQVNARAMSRKRFLQIGGAGLSSAALLGIAGCGSDEGGANAIGWQVTPTKSTESDEADIRQYVEDAIATWEENSEFSIDELITTSDVTQAMTRLLEQASQGRAPATSEIDAYTLPRFYGQLQSLDEYLGDVPLDDFFPFAREVMTDGKNIKGIQYTTDVRALFYRKDLIDNPPASWEELFQVGEELSNQVESILLYPGGRGEASTITTVLPQFWALGGELVDEQGNPLFGEGSNRQAMLESLGFVQETIERGITPRRVTEFTLESDMNGDAASKNTAMFLGGSFQTSLIAEIMGMEQFSNTWGVAPIPSKSGDDHATTAGGWAWGVFATNQEKRRATMDFLKTYYVGEKGMARWCNTESTLPTRQSVYEVSTYDSDSYTDTFREHLDNFARSRPASESYSAISSAIQVAISQVAAGESSPEQALQTAIDTVGG